MEAIKIFYELLRDDIDFFCIFAVENFLMQLTCILLVPYTAYSTMIKIFTIFHLYLSNLNYKWYNLHKILANNASSSLRSALCAASANGKAGLLTMAALFGISLSAFAGEVINISDPQGGNGYTWSNPTLTITQDGSYTFTGNEDGTATHNSIAVDTNLTVTITLSNVTIQSASCAFSIGKGAKVTLTLAGTNTLESKGSFAGLQAPLGAELIINGAGALNVTGGDYGGAGIGCGAGMVNSGSITIDSGTVTATGEDGAGIGGGGSSGGGIITINGGTVTATSATGAGIGSGNYCYDYDGIVIINGGTVIAKSTAGAAIGGGGGGIGKIAINGGTVEATSGSGAGIGNGTQGNGTGNNSGEITINGGTVTAKSSSGGAGVGCGRNNSASCTITISGGTVVAAGIGGAGIGSDVNGANSTVIIKGGTIDASSVEKAGIGGNSAPNVLIDGGSVKVSGTAAITPRNSSNNTTVYLNELTLDYPPVENMPIAKVYINDVLGDTLPKASDGVYGVKDVTTDAAGKLYFWLPATSTPQVISATTAADTTYDNLFSRNPNNSNADTLYRFPAVITNVTSYNGNQDVSGVAFITFSRPMPTGNTEDTVMLVCRECTVPEIVLSPPSSAGAWGADGRRFKIPFSGLEYSSTYRVYAKGFRDTIGRAVEKDTTHTITTRLIQTITPATYKDATPPYTIGDTIAAEKGAYTPNAGGAEGEHTYQWYRSDDSAGAGAAIPGAGSTTYIPSAEDFGKYIYIETTPVGDSGRQARPVGSEKIRIGVLLIAKVSGAHGGAATLAGKGSTAVVYDQTPIKLSVSKTFSNDSFLSWHDSCANAAAGGTFANATDATYSAPAAPTGDVTLTATLALSAPELTFPTAGSITYGDTLKQEILSGGSCKGKCCSCKGNFAWATTDTALKAGAHHLPVAFTPNDHMADYDYSSLSGWNSATGAVIRMVAVTVKKKDVFIAGGVVEPKTYDGATGAKVETLRFDGLVNGDTLLPGKDYTVNGNAKFDDPAAGSGNKTVTLTAALTSSESASNYNLINGESYLLKEQSIHKAVPDVSLLSYAPQDSTATYDEAKKVVNVEAAPGVEGLGKITVYYNGDPTPPVDAGTYPVTVLIEEGDNYSGITLPLIALTISKVDATIDLLDYASKDLDATYDRTVQPVTVKELEGVEGLGKITVLYNGDPTPPTNVGDYNVTVEIKDGKNYNDTVFTLGTLTVGKADPTPDLLSCAPEEVTFDGTPKKVVVDTLDNLGKITVYYNGDTTPPTNAGEYPITVKIEGGDSYNADSFALGKLIIHKATPDTSLLDYAPDDLKATYDETKKAVNVGVEPDVKGLGKITALYNGDTTPPTSAGEYSVTVEVKDGKNYNDTVLTLGTLIVGKADPTQDLLSYTPEKVTFDGTPKKVIVDTLDNLGKITVYYNGDTTPPTNAGVYPITVKIEGGDNYNDTTLTLGDLIIGKAQLTPDDLTFTPVRTTYDEAPHGVTVTPTFPCAKPCTSIGEITATYNGDKKMPVDTGSYVVAVTITEGDNYESVTIPLYVGIFQIRPATILRDTICLNEAYSKNGFELPKQTKSGLLTYADTIREELYDSIVQLKLLVYNSILFSVENFSICADNTEATVEYELSENSAIPSYYSVTFDKAQRFFADDVENAPLPAAIRIAPSIRPDVYSATLRLSNHKCRSKEQAFSITVAYPIMEQKWDNVIALRRGDYEFTAYQWLKNGEEIPGATLHYLYTPPALDFTATYNVLLTRADGVTLPACPYQIYSRAQQPEKEEESGIATYPTIADKGSSLTVISQQQGEAITRNTFGVGVSRQAFGVGTSRIAAPEQAGIYFIELYAADGKMKVVKILVK
jgi:hypothetical protein